ncbi:type II toxin-antitoxin system RelE/ParE family toxin [Phenylobacterium sp.]|uniref:type II toxin-antitoxin system RelE/ParE family toxin n=1 Tax=Phenylobacterium sp. TaxID=1871053 RepID=UPI00345611A2
MKPRRVVPRERARQDMRAAARYYRLEAGEDVALGFVAELRAALATIATHPGAGSPHYGITLGIAGLRSRPLGRNSYLVFYVEGDGRIEVWRVIHGRRDIASLLGAPT